MIWPFLMWFFVAVCVVAAVRRYRQAARAGVKMTPLSSDDRLRIVLALRSLEVAELELLKAAWINNQPGHPGVAQIVMELKAVEDTARRVLRGYSA